MTPALARALFHDNTSVGNSALEAYGEKAAVAAIMSLQPAPGITLAAVLRIIDSCGGPKMSQDSDEFHDGYNAALDACEREMRRAWERLAQGATA